MEVPTAVRFALALEEVGAEIERAFMEKGELTMPELKPCPFCGGEAKLVETTECWGHGEFHKVKYVACKLCGSKGHTVCDMDIYDGYADSLDDAIKHWNVRCL